MTVGNIVLAAAVVAVILCLLLYFVCSYLFRVGMEARFQRKAPRKKKTAHPPTLRQRQLQQAAQAAETWRAAQSFECVSIQSRDNLRLVGYYLPCAGAERTVLLVHGWRGSWEGDMSPFGPFLQEQRCNLLFVDQRGHGASEGKYLGFGVLERYDCLAWVSYLQRREPAGMPIYLLGCSQGAATVLMASGFALPKQVRGIIADCGFQGADCRRGSMESGRSMQTASCLSSIPARAKREPSSWTPPMAVAFSWPSSSTRNRPN